jgi:hypothetical protein
MAWRIGYSAASVLMCIGCASLCHMKGGLYICLPSEFNGPNMLDEPLKDFIVFPCLLTLEVFWEQLTWAYGLHDLQWKCTTSTECKTVIIVVFTVTSGLGPLRNSWSPMINMFLLFIIHFILIICLLFKLRPFDATNGAKIVSTKSYMLLN